MDAGEPLEFIVHREIPTDDVSGNLPLVIVGVRDAAQKSPDAVIVVMKGAAPIARIDVHFADEYHFKLEAIEWAGWIVIGFGARIVMLRLDGGPQLVTSLSERTPAYFCDYFQGFVSTPDYLLLSSGTRVFRIGRDGEVIWKSVEVGLDGVNVHDVEADAVEGSGQWDPPDGWRPFALSLSTGLRIDGTPNDLHASGEQTQQSSDVRRFDFRLVRSDWAAFVKSRKSAYLGNNWAVKAAAIFVGMIWALFEAGKFSATQQVIVFLVLGSAIVGANFMAARFVRWRKITRWREPSTPSQVCVFRDRVSIKENNSERAYPRTDITDVELGAAHVFMTAPQDDIVILPLRAFESEADMRKFYRAWAQTPIAAHEQQAAMDPPPQNSFSVISGLTPGDVRAAHASTMEDKRISLAKAAVCVSILGGFIAFGLAPLWTFFTQESLDWFQSAAFAFPGSVIAIGLAANRMEARTVSDWPQCDRRRDPVTVEINPDGLHRHGEGFTTQVAWEAVTEIRETPYHILFFTPWNEVSLLPKRCFEDPLLIPEFLAGARAWQAAACLHRAQNSQAQPNRPQSG